MAFEATSARLFGLDLGRMRGALRLGLEGILRWPAMGWLSPPKRVHVMRPDGMASICSGTSFRVVDAEANARAEFRAIVLPDEIVLAHTFRFPQLTEAEIKQALEMQLSTLSPLPTDDVVWGWRIDEVHDMALDVTLAFASRVHVEGFLQRLGLPGQTESFEIWADVDGPVLINGFGEALRRRAVRAGRFRMLALAVLTVALFAAFSVTHFWQLRARVFDAQQQLSAVQSRAAPYVGARDGIVRANDSARAISRYLQDRASAAELLEILTRMLPDNAFLTRLEVEGRTVRVTGLATNAAGLMEMLRSREGFTELRSLAPIRSGPNNYDNFSFEFVVSSVQEGV